MPEKNCLARCIEYLTGVAVCGLDKAGGHDDQIRLVNEALMDYNLCVVEVPWDHCRCRQFCASPKVLYIVRVQLANGENHCMICEGNFVIMDMYGNSQPLYSPLSILFLVQSATRTNPTKEA